MNAENPPADLSQDFIRIHKAVTRGLRVGVARGAEFIQNGFPEDSLQQGFLDYTLALAIVLDAHHLSEDEVAFPALREKLPFAPYERLSSDHLRIVALLSAIRQSIAEAAAGDLLISLPRLVESLRKIEEVWGPHIGLEEEHFSRSALGEAMDSEEQARIREAIGNHSREHATPPYLALPFVLFNLNPEDRAAMAATMPSMVMDELIPKVWKDQWAPMKPFMSIP